MIATEISGFPKFDSVDEPEIREALWDLARASHGMLYVAEDGTVSVLGSIDELQRRVVNLTGADVPPRRKGTFRIDEG
ncbi:hypothetical protein [Ferrimicrobium sp.]|uniref:hypothetical protein n=1 Tax=Ferrimicrobium sp. TaxID=2926050 RepID=UPI00263094F9|nr:hypothetical protein [Ferrimicrobium sp.]